MFATLLTVPHSGLKIQLHGMYFDTSFNSLQTAFTNVYTAFYDAALRSYHYIRSLPLHKQPSFEYVKGM
jgi:telomerase reverse transcriptase